MKRILSLAAVFVLCMACLMAGCGKNDRLPQDPPEELPPDQINAELPEGLACRPIAGRGEYEMYVTDEEKVKALSGTVVLPNFYEGFPITSIAENTFKGCMQIEEVILPECLTAVGHYCFSGSGLVRISIPDACTTFGMCVFSECTELESVNLPARLSGIPIETFVKCTSLREIAFPESLTAIGYRAFMGCSSLESITLPANLLSIDPYVFSGCTSLSPDLIIPDSVQTIGNNAFNPSGVRTVILPNGFQEIGAKVFDFATIYTAAERGYEGFKGWSGEKEWYGSLGKCFYGSSFRYDGETPYVYSVDGVDYVNQLAEQGYDIKNENHDFDDLYWNYPIFSPFREGYEFKGWSMTEGSSKIDFGLTLYDPETSRGGSRSACEYYGQGPFLTSLSLMADLRRVSPHQPLYAVWEPIA